MLLTDTFTEYCKTLNDNIDNAVKHMLSADKKYNRIFKLQEQILRQRFTTNTQDDYAPIQWTSAPFNQQAFADMIRFILQKNLMPNFFKKETLDDIRKVNPSIFDALGDKAPFAILHSLLVWNTFDEAAYLQQKQQMDWRKQEEAKIHAAAEQYRRHQQIVQTGKEQMAKIAKDPYLTDRFFFGAAAASRKKTSTEQMKKMAHSPFLLQRFVETSFKRVK